MRLSYNQLGGAIPPALGQLASLEWADLADNQLSGAIPPELGRLANLQSLALANNQLSGAIPPELGRLANLQTLALANNQLSGAIPPQLGQLANLQFLRLAGNQLSGPIPPELGRLANLQSLGLADNQLRGAIPPALGNLANLEALQLGGSNHLTGCIPHGLAEVPRSDLDRLGLLFCDADERLPDLDTLVALYHATDGANWTNNRNWLSEAPLGEWFGVTTDPNGRVTELQLEHNQLRGRSRRRSRSSPACKC